MLSTKRALRFQSCFSQSLTPVISGVFKGDISHARSSQSLVSKSLVMWLIKPFVRCNSHKFAPGCLGNSMEMALQYFLSISPLSYISDIYFQLVTVDETSLNRYDPDSKHYSMTWWNNGSENIHDLKVSRTFNGHVFSLLFF